MEENDRFSDRCGETVTVKRDLYRDFQLKRICFFHIYMSLQVIFEELFCVTDGENGI